MDSPQVRIRDEVNTLHYIKIRQLLAESIWLDKDWLNCDIELFISKSYIRIVDIEDIVHKFVKGKVVVLSIPAQLVLQDKMESLELSLKIS